MCAAASSRRNRVPRWLFGGLFLKNHFTRSTSSWTIPVACLFHRIVFAAKIELATEFRLCVSQQDEKMKRRRRSVERQRRKTASFDIQQHTTYDGKFWTLIDTLCTYVCASARDYKNTMVRIGCCCCTCVLGVNPHRNRHECTTLWKFNAIARYPFRCVCIVLWGVICVTCQKTLTQNGEQWTCSGFLLFCPAYGTHCLVDQVLWICACALKMRRFGTRAHIAPLLLSPRKPQHILSNCCCRCRCYSLLDLAGSNKIYDRSCCHPSQHLLLHNRTRYTGGTIGTETFNKSAFNLLGSIAKRIWTFIIFIS